MLTFALDFDGTIVEADEPLRLRPSARQAIEDIKRAGHRLVLFSARCTPIDPTPELDDQVARWYATGEVPTQVTDQWKRFEEMRAFLKAERLWDLFDDIWQAPGKPYATVYVDDRFVSPDWPALAATYGEPHERQPIPELGYAKDFSRSTDPN